MISGFYTSISKRGNFIMYRGYDDLGKRIQQKIKFKPTYYAEAKDGKATHKSLDGLKLSSMTFPDIKQADEYEKMYSGVRDYQLFGNSNHITSFIQTQFPGEIRFKKEFVNIGSFDIETEYGDGFPDADNPTNRILTVAYKSSKEDFYRVWGMKPYDTKESELDLKTEYKQFDNEEGMLLDFIDFWSDPENTPDIITGWNTEFFDVPYLLCRVERILGDSVMKRFSPWGQINQGSVKMFDREQKTLNIVGIPNLDYMALFKKFAYAYGTQETYKLDHIAHVVLNDRKLDYSEIGSLRDLYDADFQKYVDYNIKDVELIERLEEKLGLINLVMTTAYLGGVNYTQTLGTVGIWDTIIYRRLMRSKTVPTLLKLNPSDYPIYGADVVNFEWSNGKMEGYRGKARAIAGGYVKEVRKGMSEWVMSFDLNSLYPNIIIQNNMSPETLVPHSHVNNVFPNRILKEESFPTDIDLCRAGNGSVYRKDKKGIIPEIVEELYSMRVEIKGRMIEGKKELEKDPKNKSLVSQVMRNETQQTAVKILLNSLYGAMANKYFRYYDPQVAEGVTLTGQCVIQWAEKAVNEEIQKFLGEDKSRDRVIAIDTDSVYITAKDVVDKFKPKNPVNFLDEFGNRVIEPALNRAFERFAEMSNAYTNRMVMKREAIADRGIWTAKKRYILNVHNNEGVQYAEPKIKMMGIEAIKSSTPQLNRTAMKEIFKVIMTGSEEKTQEAIALFKEHFLNSRPEEIASPRKVSDVIKWRNRETIYDKGTPMHVRASLLFNHHVKKNGIDNNYELIYNGDNMKYIYMMTPNSIRENIFGFKDAFPHELKLEKYIDYELQFQKTFIEPINMILKTLNWTDEKVVSLQDFFC